MFISNHAVSQEWPKRADKASLLTASGVLLNAFPLMFTSLLHVTSSISGKLCLQTATYYFIEYLQRKLLTANFLP